MVRYARAPVTCTSNNSIKPYSFHAISTFKHRTILTSLKKSRKRRRRARRQRQRPRLQLKKHQSKLAPKSELLDRAPMFLQCKTECFKPAQKLNNVDITGSLNIKWLNSKKPSVSSIKTRMVSCLKTIFAPPSTRWVESAPMQNLNR